MAGEKPLADLSDADITRVLREHGEPVVPITGTTRPFLLRKVERLLTKNSEDTRDAEPSTDCETVSRETRSGEEKSSTDCETVSRKTPLGEEKFEGYYGVAGLNEGAAALGPLGPSAPLSPSVYTSRAEVLKVLKSTPRARFKRFDSPESAEAFSRLHSSPSMAATTGSPLVSEERANDYPAPKLPDLSNFRRVIESGDVSAFTAAVRSNPRYLISSSDTPQVGRPADPGVSHGVCVHDNGA